MLYLPTQVRLPTAQKWLNWLIARWGTPERRTSGRERRRRSGHSSGTRDVADHSGSPGAPPAHPNVSGSGGSVAPPPRVCHLDPRRFLNGQLVQELGLPTPPSCSCAAQRGGKICEARRQRVVSPLHAAHLNFALSASHKLCLAKGMGLWLLSGVPEHQGSFEFASAASRHASQSIVEAFRRRALRSMNSSSGEFAANDGLVVAPNKAARAPTAAPRKASRQVQVAHASRIVPSARNSRHGGRAKSRLE